MTYNREVREAAADKRQDEVVREAQSTRARLEEALDRLEQELRHVRQVAREDYGVPVTRKPWWRR